MDMYFVFAMTFNAAILVIALMTLLQCFRLVRKTTRTELRVNQFASEQPRQNDAHFRQLEDLTALYHELQPLKAFPRTRGYPASPDFLRVVMEQVEGNRPAAVIELGSGVSTLVIGYSLSRLGSGHLYSVDHDAGYLEKTRASVAEHGLSSYVTLIHAPLVENRHSNAPWYDIDESLLPEAADILVIDGPPGGDRWPQVRYPALPELFDQLASGAVILVDDAARVAETACIRRWRDEYPQLSEMKVDCEKGCVLLTKQDSGPGA